MKLASLLIYFFVSATVSAQSLSDLQDDYKTLRQKFTMQALDLRSQFAGVRLRSEKVPSTFDNSLFIDSVYVPAIRSPKKLVILTSGVHGVEAAAGSFSQRTFMAGLLKDRALNRYDTATLIIHIVNPYGFKHGRRTNENNVDLNRNCFDYRADAWPGVWRANPAYEKMRNALENPMGPVSLAVQGIFRAQTIREALGGQYSSPNGIYFGGESLQPECKIVQKLIEPYANEAEQIAHFDFHTGLGPKGLTQIMLNAPDQDALTDYRRELAMLQDVMFLRRECAGICEVQGSDQASLVTVGDFTQWLHMRYPEKRKTGLILSVTSEIGTYHPLITLPAIVNENYCHWHPEACNPEKMAERTQILRDVFNPKDEQWQDQLQNAAFLTCRALLRFSEN